jgi:hypothetical protein
MWDAQVGAIDLNRPIAFRDRSRQSRNSMLRLIELTPPLLIAKVDAPNRTALLVNCYSKTVDLD